MSKKKPRYLPLATLEVSGQQLEERFGKFLRKKNTGYLVIETSKVTETMLLLVTDSPQRVLLRPETTGKDHKKAKSCCDKRCSGCTIPMRSSATIGYFVERRIRKALKKDKWAAKFFTHRTTSALDKIGIQVYTALVGMKKPFPELTKF